MNLSEKITVFQQFYNLSEYRFKSIERKFGEETLKNIYLYEVCPGGSRGGLDNYYVEVFYGYRTFIRHRRLNINHQIVNETEIEYGARLNFNQIANGDIYVSLTPCWSKKLMPIEEEIFLDFVKNPNKLLKKKIQIKYWKYFSSYTKVTSLIGEPDLLDRFRVWKLRTFKTLIIDKKQIKPKIQKFLAKSFEYALTVGFSGSLLALLQFFCKGEDHSKTMIEKMEIIINEQSNISKTIKDLNHKNILEEQLKELNKINKNIVK
jgi:hypothetical protein